MKSLVLGSLMIAATMGMANAQDLAAGEQSFRKCSPCHSVGEDARNKVGPVLNGLEGRKSGTIGDYSYSEANKKAEIVWRAKHDTLRGWPNASHSPGMMPDDCVPQ